MRDIKSGNHYKVMAMKEGDIATKAGILTKGFVDNRKTLLNLDRIDWIEDYAHPSRTTNDLFMAVFAGHKKILIYRDLKEGE